MTLSPPGAPESGPTSSSVRDVLACVIDPELGIDIVALGLVRDVGIECAKISVTMTLTTPGCPLGDTITRDARTRLERHAPDHWIDVVLTWDPPWSADQMTVRAREALGFR